MIKHILYEIRWWHWFLIQSPSVFDMHQRGLDRNSRDVLQKRWLDSEPSFNGLYPHRRVQQTVIKDQENG